MVVDEEVETEIEMYKEEIERRKKIDAELNRMAVVLNDPKLGTAYRTPKQMEAIYNNYRFEGLDD